MIHDMDKPDAGTGAGRLLSPEDGWRVQLDVSGSGWRARPECRVGTDIAESRTLLT